MRIFSIDLVRESKMVIIDRNRETEKIDGEYLHMLNFVLNVILLLLLTDFVSVMVQWLL